MKGILMVLLAVGLSKSVLAAPKQITVHVNGMVCDFCSTGIHKKFSSQEAVSETKVDLGQKQVRFTLKEGKDISDSKIDELIRDSGFNVERIERQQ